MYAERDRIHVGVLMEIEHEGDRKRECGEGDLIQMGVLRESIYRCS